jgi:TolB-like protein/Tfp pilus assembly protein PilF
MNKLSTKAIFLSYASQDGEAARRICEALRAGGIEVWFDQSELRGGDAWDQKIRGEIRECALFIPIISTNTQARPEGYFRLEWRLADQRTHLMGKSRAFLVPVCIDDTRDADADVPDSFAAVQWTRLPNGETPPAFVERVAGLLSPERISTPAANRVAAPSLPPRPGTASVRRSRAVAMFVALAIALLGIAYTALDKFVLSKHVVASDATVSAPGAMIPEQSIAVLPFTDMSEKKDQDYFSDGLTEQMIDMLSQVPELRVPARTSSFYFKDKNETIANIAKQLKVAHVLEGSVRKAGNRLRITAQLIRADSGYHLWSQTYDREDKDIFAVQDDIARSVVTALKVTLAAALQTTGSRGTGNDEAYDQFLLGRQLDRLGSLEGNRLAFEAYEKAIALDPNYAAAYAGRAVAEGYVADLMGDRGGLERAGHDVEKAIELAPNDPGGYLARSYIRQNWLWDWFGAQADIEKALTLDPRNSDAHFQYALLLESLGRLPEATAAQKNATELDSLSSQAWRYLARLYTETGDYVSADAALGRALELEPTSVFALTILGRLRLAQGRAQEALDVFRNMDDLVFSPIGVAMAEHTLGHAKESQKALDEVIATHGQVAGYQIAEVYAWRGEKDKAFEWLERAYQHQDGGLSRVKGDALLKSLRNDPRFNALLRKMNLPE